MICAVLALATLIIPVQGPLDTTYSATVSVTSTTELAKVSPNAVGIGVAVWDAHMTDPAAGEHVRNAGFKVIRYPGGSYADLYQWKTGMGTNGYPATIRPNTDFDSFMSFARRFGVSPLITVNYGSNPEGTGGADPAYAADWVRYSNVQKKYGVKFWEIGNEVYGNGFYNGKGWEVDLHAPEKGERLKNPPLGPLAYASNVNEFVRQMKAVDPTIKVGAVLTTPCGWPDGVDPDWNRNVLKTCGQNVDFVVVHWYGFGDTPDKLLDSVSQVPGILTKLHALVDQFCRPGTKIWMTEGDAGSFNMRHAGALFATHHLLSWWENGCEHVDWWDLHNGLGVGNWGYDDQGLLSSGHTRQGIKQPPANTPFPPYYGIALASKAARPGDVLLKTDSNSPSLLAHSVKRADGKTALVLINRNWDHACEVTLKGVSLKAPFEVWSYECGFSSLRRKRMDPSTDYTLRVPAASILVAIG